MADSELLRHQQIWHGFTSFVKFGTGGVLLLVILLWYFLVV